MWACHLAQPFQQCRALEMPQGYHGVGGTAPFELDLQEPGSALNQSSRECGGPDEDAKKCPIWAEVNTNVRSVSIAFS